MSSVTGAGESVAALIAGLLAVSRETPSEPAASRGSTRRYPAAGAFPLPAAPNRMLPDHLNPAVVPIATRSPVAPTSRLSAMVQSRGSNGRLVSPDNVLLLFS